MNDQQHSVLKFSDRLMLVGELEHLSRHLMLAGAKKLDEDYQLLSEQATAVRRFVMSHYDISEENWCIVKSNAIVMQLAIEQKDIMLLSVVSDLVSEVYSKTLGVDLDLCSSCKEDKNETE